MPPFNQGFGGPQQGPEFMFGDQYQMDLRNALMNQFRQDRENDFADGRKRGLDTFGEGSLGRLSESRSPQVQELLDRYQQQMGGFTGEQYQAKRERGLSDLNRTTQGNLAQLQAQQARAGVRGGTAAAQYGDILRGQQQNAANVYRDLMIGDVQEKSRALGAYGGALNQAQSDEQSRKMYNMGQAAKEKQGRLAFEFGFGQLGAADRGAAQRWIAGKQQIAAAEASKPPPAAPGGK